jgi:ATP-dependent helicase HrpB
VAAYLDDCPVLVSEGRSWPVRTLFLDQPDARAMSEQAADAVERIVRSGEPGDILVFMPGMAEIQATLRAVESTPAGEPLALLPLHGDLPPEEQDRAFAPHPRRKVVVATNVAETSVTIDGIRHIVDSGLARVARYDAERGIHTLALEPISRASADQRQGRAGRTAPGTCHRLWTESADLDRPERNTPEIQRSDLAEVVLLLHSLGIRRAAQFDWLDRPDPAAVERAEKLLLLLGALAPEAATAAAEPSRAPAAAPPPLPASDLAPLGRRMLRLPMHPRFARMLLEASHHGCVPAAALCAALVSGRDLLVRLGRDNTAVAEARELFETSNTSDFFTLLRAYEFARQRRFAADACRRYGIHAQTARQVQQTVEQILQIAARERLVTSRDTGLAAEPRSASSHGSEVSHESAPVRVEALPSSADPAPASETPPRAAARSVSDANDEPLLRCLLAGFIDQLCVRRRPGSAECDLTQGRSGTLARESVVQDAPLFVAASVREVSGRVGEPRTLVSLATGVKREWILEMFPSRIERRVEHLFDRTHKRVAAVNLVRFDDLVIHHEHQRDLDPDAAGACLAEAFARGWFELPLLNHALRQFAARVNLVCAAMPELEFPPLDAAGLASVLKRALRGVATVKEAQATHLTDAFRKHLAPEQLAWLDELAPQSIAGSDGRAHKLLYTDADPEEARAPGGELSVKLHECFALKEHPRLCEGREPITLWLCAPDGKRIEATRDWPAFRATRYPQLRRALAQRYPGIAWL